MHTEFNKWMLERYETFCGNECPVGALLYKMSEDEGIELMRVHCNRCITKLFIQKLIG
jgi:hypothetical protein